MNLTLLPNLNSSSGSAARDRPTEFPNGSLDEKYNNLSFLMICAVRCGDVCNTTAKGICKLPAFIASLAVGHL